MPATVSDTAEVQRIADDVRRVMRMHTKSLRKIVAAAKRRQFRLPLEQLLLASIADALIQKRKQS
jgi:hypothetical protein